MADPRGVVERYLARSGFPLEFEAARAFSDADFGVHQGIHYGGEATDRPREIDVLAVREHLSASPRPIRITLVWAIECKAHNAPWVVLCRPADDAKWGAVGHLPLHPLSEMDVLGELEATDDPVLLRLPGPLGIRVVVADDKPRADPAYEALTQSVSAARAIVADNRSMIPTLAFPVVVTGGPLFTMEYRADGTTHLSERPWHRVLWRGHPNGGSAAVDVVASGSLAAFARDRAAAAPELLDLLHRAWIEARMRIMTAEEERRYGPTRRTWIERVGERLGF